MFRDIMQMVPAGRDIVLLNAQNAVCGIIRPMDDKILRHEFQRAKIDSRPFKRDMVTERQIREYEARRQASKAYK